MDTTFQRARSDEQRAIRRQTILDTATAMLEEMPVSELSLNELSRRVGLAKSNVLRYFDSREAVLLELLDSLTREWLEHLSEELRSAVSARAGFERRSEQLAGALARSLAERPVLCDLLGAQASVLEHNVSSDAIASFKRRGVASADHARRPHPRRSARVRSEDQAWRLVLGAWLLTSSLWAHARRPRRPSSRPSPPTNAWRRRHLDFPAMLADSLTTLAVGLHARATG